MSEEFLSCDDDDDSDYSINFDCNSSDTSDSEDVVRERNACAVVKPKKRLDSNDEVDKSEPSKMKTRSMRSREAAKDQIGARKTHSTNVESSSSDDGTYHKSPVEIYDFTWERNINPKSVSGCTKAFQSDSQTAHGVVEAQILGNSKKVQNQADNDCETEENNGPDKCKDVVLRLPLKIRGKRKCNLFKIRLSNLLSMVKNDEHPLHKWANVLTIENMVHLPENDVNCLIDVLSKCVEVRTKRIKVIWVGGHTYNTMKTDKFVSEINVTEPAMLMKFTS